MVSINVIPHLAQQRAAVDEDLVEEDRPAEVVVERVLAGEAHTRQHLLAVAADGAGGLAGDRLGQRRGQD